MVEDAPLVGDGLGGMAQVAASERVPNLASLAWQSPATNGLEKQVEASQLLSEGAWGVGKGDFVRCAVQLQIVYKSKRGYWRVLLTLKRSRGYSPHSHHYYKQPYMRKRGRLQRKMGRGCTRCS